MVKIGRDINEYAFYSLYILTAPNLIELDSYDYLRMGPFITCNLFILSQHSTYKLQTKILLPFWKEDKILSWVPKGF